MIDYISDILPFLIVVAVVIFKLYKSANEVQRVPSDANDASDDVQPSSFPEAFPTVEPLQTVTEPKSNVHNKKISKVKKDIKYDRDASPQAGIETQNSEAQQEHAGSLGKFSIRTKSDAKRAIIYSEIFNKKY